MAYKSISMKLNAGIITAKLRETKNFYQDVLGFGVVFESDWYILLHTPGKESEIAFLQPGHESQQPIFQSAFEGKGVFFTIEVGDVDKMYQELLQKKVPIQIEIRDEPWGDRHFAIQDPNGIGVDIVTYTTATQ